MYPDFQYLFQSLLGIDAPHFLSYFKVFGFFVAIAFIAAARVLGSELVRKEKQGLLKPELVTQKDKEGKTTQKWVYPHDRIFDFVVVAILAGLAGAKIFNAFETWDSFIQDPIGNLFSASGLTFYGGLICAALAMYFFARKHKISFRQLCDATAPALMLAYGIGRLGCHFAGDGDWGIFNSAYISNPDGTLKVATVPEYEQRVKDNTAYFLRDFHSLDHVPHAYTPAPSGVPRWLVAMNYPHNVNNDGVHIQNCEGSYCYALPVAVYPTSVYEAIVCIGLFLLLWAFRKRMVRPLKMFGWYLIANGIERFLIEKIRVNTKYDWGFIHPTQAEIISVLMFACGVALVLFYNPKKEIQPQSV